MSTKNSPREKEICPLGLRFIELQDESGLNRGDFARSIPISPGYYTDILYGSKIPSEKIYNAMVWRFGIEKEWLEHGTGEKYRDNDKKSLENRGSGGLASEAYPLTEETMRDAIEGWKGQCKALDGKCEALNLVIDARDREIQGLKEKVAVLEANRKDGTDP